MKHSVFVVGATRHDGLPLLVATFFAFAAIVPDDTAAQSNTEGGARPRATFVAHLDRADGIDPVKDQG